MFLQLQLQTEELPKAQLHSLGGKSASARGRNPLLPALLMVLMGFFHKGFSHLLHLPQATVNLLLHGKGNNVKPSKPVT